jgi:hypothetical protein
MDDWWIMNREECGRKLSCYSEHACRPCNVSWNNEISQSEVAVSEPRFEPSTFLTRKRRNTQEIATFGRTQIPTFHFFSPWCALVVCLYPNCVRLRKWNMTYKPNKLHDLSQREIYTDQTTAACWRSDCQLFADRGCHVVNVKDPYGRILGFLDRSLYFSSKVAPQLYSRGWVDPVPDPVLLRKSGSPQSNSGPLDL